MRVFQCPSSSSLSLAVGLCLVLWLSLSVDESASYSPRRRFGTDYYGNGKWGAAEWHRGLEHLAFPSSSSAGQQQQQRLDEDDSSSSINSSPGVLFYAAPRFLQQMGRGMETGQNPSSAAAAAGGGDGAAAEDRVRKSSALRPTDREIQQFRVRGNMTTVQHGAGIKHSLKYNTIAINLAMTSSSSSSSS